MEIKEGDKVKIREEMELYMPDFSRLFGRSGEVIEVGDEWISVIFPTLGDTTKTIERDGKEYIRDANPLGNVIGAFLNRYEDVELVNEA